jgi:putative ABC transport system substrate-binding protein
MEEELSASLRSKEPPMSVLRLACALALALVACARPAASAEVAILKTSDVVAWRPTLDAMRRALPTHTFAEHDLRGDRAEADRVVAGLKGRSGVIVLALGPLAVQALRDGAPELPLVYGMVQDPAGIGLANAANTFGVSFTIPIKNQLAAFRMVYPRGVRVGVIYSEEHGGRLVQEAVKAAQVVRLVLVERPVQSDREIPEALRSLLRGAEAVDALWIPPDPVLLNDETRRFLLAETLKAGRPVYSFSAALVGEGALVSNGPDLASVGAQLAELVGRAAGGEKGKGELLIPRAELVINRKIAEKLKIEIPADALKAASRVF